MLRKLIQLFTKPALGSFYCDSGSKNARKILRKVPLKIASYSDKADLIWLRHNKDEYISQLAPRQLLNHLPNEGVMVDKAKLANRLQKYNQQHPECDLDSFFQPTFYLNNPAERNQFLSQLPAQDHDKNIWILKPANLSKGQGVKIVCTLDQIKKDCKVARDNPGRFDYIAQRYIHNPLLLDGKKSEIRIYWLIVSLDPLLVYVYQEGTVRLNSKAFKLADFDNQLIHVTNTFQQKNHPDYDPKVELKWTFAELNQYLATTYQLDDNNFMENSFMPKIHRIIANVVNACRKELTVSPKNGLCFGLFGADIIIDDQLNPFLTEIQLGPGLSHTDRVKKKLIANVLTEATKIVFELMQHKSPNTENITLKTSHKFKQVML